MRKLGFDFRHLENKLQNPAEPPSANTPGPCSQIESEELALPVDECENRGRKRPRSSLTRLDAVPLTCLTRSVSIELRLEFIRYCSIH